MTCRFACSGQHGAHAAGTCEKYRGFQAYHLHVFSDRDILAAFEFHVELLTLVYFHGSVIEQPQNCGENVGGAVGYKLCGKREHGVAGKDCCAFRPPAVDCRASAAHVGAVHHVVVEKREVVEHLYPESLLQRVFRVFTTESAIRGQQ